MKHRVGVGAAWAAALFLSGCPARGGNPDAHFELPDVVLPDVYFVPPYDANLPVNPFACVGGTHDVETAMIAAAHDRFQTLEEGLVDLPLTTSGCVRVEREVAGGAVRALRFYRIGYPTLRSNLAEWTVDAAGVVTGRVDADDEPDAEADDFYEHQSELDPTAGRLVRTTYDVATREIVERTTVERQPDDTLRWRRERLVSGSLATIEDFPVELDHVAGGHGGGRADCADAGCDAATLARLNGIMRDALSRGFECLTQTGSARGTARARALAALALAWTGSHRFTCVPSDCWYNGLWDLRSQLAGRPLHVSVRTGRTDAEITETLFHELTHGVAGVHSRATLALLAMRDLGPNYYEQLDAVDPAYACARMCFGTVTPNQCNCAACLDVRVCDPACSSYASCVVRAPGMTTGPVHLSEAVGAACHVGDVYTWWGSMAECTAACSGGSCTSYSRSCDATCN
jgi:hypothetical protein